MIIVIALNSFRVTEINYLYGSYLRGIYINTNIPHYYTVYTFSMDLQVLCSTKNLSSK